MLPEFSSEQFPVRFWHGIVLIDSWRFGQHNGLAPRTSFLSAVDMDMEKRCPAGHQSPISVRLDVKPRGEFQIVHDLTDLGGKPEGCLCYIYVGPGIWQFLFGRNNDVLAVMIRDVGIHGRTNGERVIFPQSKNVHD